MRGNRSIRIGVLVCAACFASALAPQAALAARSPNVAIPPSCLNGFSLGGEGRTLAELPGAPEAAVLNSFAVLRRAAVPSDQPPPLNSLDQEFGFELAGYYPGEVRRLIALPDGRSFYLVVGLPRVVSLPPARCLPPSLRSKRKQIVEQEAKRAREPVYCIGQGRAERGVLSLGQDCRRFADIAAGGALETLVFASPGVTADLVPDGVATVRVSFRDRSVISCVVSQNAYLFSPPASLVRAAKKLAASLRSPLSVGSQRLSGSERREYQRRFDRAFRKLLLLGTPTRIEWLSAQGAVVRTITPAGSLRGLVSIGG